MIKTITDSSGITGFLHEINLNPDSILIFQLPRTTDQLSSIYIEGSLKSIKEILPAGKKAMVVGCDVNVYELPGMDASVLILKGLI